MKNNITSSQVAALKETAVQLIGTLRLAEKDYDQLVADLTKHGLLAVKPDGVNEIEYLIIVAESLSKQEFAIKANEDREDILRYARTAEPTMRAPGIRSVTSRFFRGIADAISG